MKQHHRRRNVPPSPACSLQCHTTVGTHWSTQEATYHLDPDHRTERTHTPLIPTLKSKRKERKLSV